MAAPNLKNGITEYVAPADRLTVTAAGTIAAGNVVKLNGNRTVIVAGANDIPLGIALHDAASGEAVTVALVGVWPCKANGAIAAGDLVGTAASGDVTTIAASGGAYVQAEANEYRTVVGLALEAISNGAVGRVLLKL